MGAGKRIRRTIIKPEDMRTRRSEDLETVWGGPAAAEVALSSKAANRFLQAGSTPALIGFNKNFQLGQ